MRDRTRSFLRRTAALWVIVVVGIVGYLAVGAFADDGDEKAAESQRHDHDSHDHSDESEAKDEHEHEHEEATAALPAVDPCTLLTATELTDLLGADTTGTELDPTGLGPVTEDQRVCRYAAPEKAAGTLLGITDKGARQKLATLATSRSAISEQVTGVGETARWIAPFRLLVVVEGDWFLSVQLEEVSADPGVTKAKALELASAALARLSDDGRVG
jgi:hypothetical protein